MTRTQSSGDMLALANRVLETARLDPGRPAVVHARSRRGGIRYETYSYRQLAEAAESIAVGLRRIGIAEGTRCSFMVPPSFDAIALGVALHRVGAVLVGIEPASHGLRRTGACLRRVAPEAFFGTAEAHLARVVFGWSRQTIKHRIVVGERRLPGTRTLSSLMTERFRWSEEPADPDVDGDAPAAIVFTTGTTGKPKPALVRQRNLAATAELIVSTWGFTDGREVVDMPTFPIFWLVGLLAGGTVVVPPMDFARGGPAAAAPELLLRTINECGVRSMFGSPALLDNLARYAIDHDITTPTLRRVVAGGAEVPRSLFDRVRRVLPSGGEVFSTYGATEAVPLAEIDGATVLAETWPRTTQGAGVCVGRPLDGVAVRIIALTDGPLTSWSEVSELEPGEQGEVVVRGAHISESYFRDRAADDENKISDPDGAPWHRTGDTGYLDNDGRLWLCGRRTQRVTTSGGSLYPLRCEPIFNAHPGVERSALVGVKQVPVICIDRSSTGHGRDERALRAELLNLAASHPSTRTIKHVVFIDTLPVDRRHNAKIDRPALAAMAAGAM